MIDMVERKRHYIKRFGNIAIEKGYIILDEFIDAMTIQVKEEIEHGSHRLIGSILLENDMLTGDQLQEIVDAVLSQDAEKANL